MGEQISKLFKEGVEIGFKAGNVTNGQYIAMVFKQVPFDKLKNIYENSDSLKQMFEKNDLIFPKDPKQVNFFLSDLTDELSDEIAEIFKKSCQ